MTFAKSSIKIVITSSKRVPELAWGPADGAFLIGKGASPMCCTTAWRFLVRFCIAIFLVLTSPSAAPFLFFCQLASNDLEISCAERVSARDGASIHVHGVCTRNTNIPNDRLLVKGWATFVLETNDCSTSTRGRPYIRHQCCYCCPPLITHIHSWMHTREMLDKTSTYVQIQMLLY